jgi:hypothetical protein
VAFFIGVLVARLTASLLVAVAFFTFNGQRPLRTSVDLEHHCTTADHHHDDQASGAQQRDATTSPLPGCHHGGPTIGDHLRTRPLDHAHPADPVAIGAVARGLRLPPQFIGVHNAFWKGRIFHLPAAHHVLAEHHAPLW